MPSRLLPLFLRLLFLMIIMLFMLLLCAQVLEQPEEQLTNWSTTPHAFDVDELEAELPEVDFKYWYRYAMPGNYRLNQSCAQYPDPLELQLHNRHWQTFLNSNVTFRLYAAYLDTRAALNSSTAVIRVLATANQIGLGFPHTYCQLWYAGHREPIMSAVSRYISIWPTIWSIKPRLSYPHLLSCPVPEGLPRKLEGITPRTVSLTTSSCEHASNSLRVHYKVPANRTLNIGICLKAFEFPYEDISSRLIEWLEMQRLLGASRVYAYVYQVHPGVQRTLEFYQRSGFLELRPLSLANGAPASPRYLHTLLRHRQLLKRLNELIPYNDCFYRNMYRHDYLLNVDIDEVIMPLGGIRTWQQLITTELATAAATTRCIHGYVSLCFIQSLFTIQSHPDELQLLQSTFRRQNHTRENVATKCFHNTLYSQTLHNHYSLTALPGTGSGATTGVCERRFVKTQVAQMQHYRDRSGVVPTEELIQDRSIWRYAKELRAAVKGVKRKLVM